MPKENWNQIRSSNITEVLKMVGAEDLSQDNQRIVLEATREILDDPNKGMDWIREHKELLKSQVELIRSM